VDGFVGLEELYCRRDNYHKNLTLIEFSSGIKGASFLFWLSVNFHSNSTEIRVPSIMLLAEKQSARARRCRTAQRLAKTVAIKAQPVNTRDTGRASVMVELKG
jgi:hypothetical protein